MNIWLVLNLSGGLAVFLYGMVVMNENIIQSAGNKLKTLLMKLTGGRFKGFLTGLGITSVVQSSSAVTVMEVGLVGAGLMTFYQSLAVTMGAEVGTTVTAQLIAFRITQYALLITAVGFFPHLIAKSKKIKNIFGTILGFGFLFLGMAIMSDALKPLRSYQPFLDLMTRVESPVIGILVGLIFTLIIQSSSATSGIVVAMAISGTITLPQAIPLNLGASIGTSITAFLGSLALNREAKRAAYAHTVSQTIGVFIVFLIMMIPHGTSNLWQEFCIWFTRAIIGTDDLARQIAMAHTLMPVLRTLIVLPVLPLFAKVMLLMFPSKADEVPFGPKHITEELLDTPFALEKARLEIIHQMEITKCMLDALPACFHKETRSDVGCEQVSLTDIKVDVLRKVIVEYLSKVGQRRNLAEGESKEEISLLYISNDIEAIGDIVDKNILPLAQKMLSLKLAFSLDGWHEIMALHQRMMNNYDNMLRAFGKNDLSLAKVVAEEKVMFAKFENELRLKHIERLHSGIKETSETSAIHIDLIEQYKRINSYIASIGYAMLYEV